MEYKRNISEPWFSLIAVGLKKYEGRLNDSNFQKMKKGDTIIYDNNSMGFLRTIKCKIINIKKYKSFKEFLEKRKLKKCLPGIDTIERGIEVYKKVYKAEDENRFGVLGIKLKIIGTG